MIFDQCSSIFLIHYNSGFDTKRHSEKNDEYHWLNSQRHIVGMRHFDVFDKDLSQFIIKPPEYFTYWFRNEN